MRPDSFWDFGAFGIYLLTYLLTYNQNSNIAESCIFVVHTKKTNIRKNYDIALSVLKQ